MTDDTEKKGRAPGGGRKALHPAEGPMKNLTIRLPPSLKARLDLVFRNDPDYSSRSNVVADALEFALPKMEKKIAAANPAPQPAATADVPACPFPPPQGV